MSEVIHALITPFRGELAALGTAFFWAFATIIYSRLGRFIHPVELNLIKGALAIGMILLTLFARGGVSIHIESFALWVLLLSGALGIGIGDTFYFESLKCLGSRRALLLSILTPPVAGLMALLFLAEVLSIAAWCGIVITVGGVTWVVTERVHNMDNIPNQLCRGIVFGLLAVLVQAGGVVLARAAFVQTRIDPLSAALLRLSGGEVILLIWIVLMRKPIGRWLRRQESKGIWGRLLLATFTGSFLGIWLQQVSLKFTSAGIAQTLFSTSPIFILPMVVLLGERISFRAVLGAFLALAGIGLLFLFKG